MSLILGVEIGEELLELALTHRSFAYENGGVANNERLEFLGDAVIQMVVTEYLFKAFRKEKAGGLTELRAALVCGSLLSEVAEDLFLHEFIYVSRGQRKDKIGRASCRERV